MQYTTRPIPHDELPLPVRSSMSTTSSLSSDVRSTGSGVDMVEDGIPHMLWSQDDVKSVKLIHKPALAFVDKMALGAVTMNGKIFDFVSGYAAARKGGFLHASHWLNRLMLYETLSNGSAAAATMCRHFRSLRMLRRDYGWVHSLVEDAENERMHLLLVLTLKHAGLLQRLFVMMFQWMCMFMFSLTYLISPRMAHRMIAYSEETAIQLYTELLNDIDRGQFFQTTPVPEFAIKYWHLPADCKMRDVFLSIRADESRHRDVNHLVSDMTSNPEAKDPFLGDTYRRIQSPPAERQ